MYEHKFDQSDTSVYILCKSCILAALGGNPYSLLLHLSLRPTLNDSTSKMKSADCCANVHNSSVVSENVWAAV